MVNSFEAGSRPMKHSLNNNKKKFLAYTFEKNRSILINDGIQKSP
jgi:hypothetical protein